MSLHVQRKALEHRVELNMCITCRVSSCALALGSLICRGLGSFHCISSPKPAQIKKISVYYHQPCSHHLPEDENMSNSNQEAQIMPLSYHQNLKNRLHLCVSQLNLQYTSDCFLNINADLMSRIYLCGTLQRSNYLIQFHS